MGLSRARRLQLLQHEIATAALSGTGLDDIERSVIAQSHCSDDDKTALRLYAFSFLSRFEQRRVALDRLSAAQCEEDRRALRIETPLAPESSTAGQATGSCLERA